MPTRRAVVRSLVALTAPSWLVACGGGSGGGDSSTTANATANTASNATPFRIERATANATPTLVFSRPVDPSSTSAIRLLDSDGEPVAIDIVTAGKDVTLVPKERLALQGQYVVQADARVRGTNGETLADNVKIKLQINDGAWGEARLFESDDRGTAIEPDIAVNARGDAIAVWELQITPSERIVWARVYDRRANAWKAPLVVAQLTQRFEARPRVAIDRAGNAMVAWTQNTDDGSFSAFARRYDTNAGFWCEEANNVADGGVIDVAVDPASGDAALLVGSNTLDAAHYNAKLARWAPAERISEDLDGGQGYRGPARLLADGNGGFGIVWLVVSGSIPVLLLARYSPRAGTWTVQPVFEGERFAVDVSSFFGFAFDEQRNLGYIALRPNNIDGNAIVIYRYDLATNQRSTLTAPTTPPGYFEIIDLKIDGRGRLALFWGTLGGRVHTQRYDGKSDGWSAPVEVNAGFAGQAGEFNVVYDRHGNAVALWRNLSGTSEDPNGRIVSARYDANTMRWSAPRRIDDGTGSSARPVLAGAPSGQVFALWAQTVNRRGDIWINTFE